MKEKQIEEMATDLYDNRPYKDLWLEDAEDIAKVLYEAGYRKQNEGRWKKIYDKAPQYVCTACKHLFNNKSYKFCPNCGAKMKGE